MKLKKIIFILVLALPLLAFTLHKYYVSLCEVEYVKEKKSVQIILSIFIDDLEFTINKDFNKQLYLASEIEVNDIDSYYKEYLAKYFKVTINNTAKKYSFIGKEYDSNIVHFYLEITDIEALNSIEILNNCLFKDFKDQQNIIKIKVNKFNKTFYLNNKNPKALLNFQ